MAKIARIRPDMAKILMAATIESMETRVLLSGTLANPTLSPLFVGYNSNPAVSVSSRVAQIEAGSGSPGGITPANMRSAYGLATNGLNNITFNGGIQGDGTGQTIALIDALNAPSIVSDLTKFDAYYSFPNPPSFTVENQNGGTIANQTATTGTSPSPSGSSGDSIESTLDVEWAHVMAPGANIILFEANSLTTNDLYTAAVTAANTPGVSVISMSFGGGESSNETSYDSDFVTPLGHTGVSFFASTGDSGAEVIYPAESPNVVAVGGTTLTLSQGNYSSEKAWSSGGGGTSAYEARPTFQAGTLPTATKREGPDVSLDADPNSGVPIYDAYDEGTNTPWATYGGTSLSSPMWAGLVAVANQGRVAEGLTNLTGTQTLTRLYQLPATAYHDITTGSNGHAAVAGYDEATGIGTPIANVLIPDLAGTATITGRLFVDANANGTYDTGDVPLTTKAVYLDLNNDGVQDNGEPTTSTNSSGIYTFTDQPAGGTVRLVAPAISGYTLTSPSSVAYSYGSSATANFIYQYAPAKVVITQQPPTSATVATTISPVIVNVENINGVTVPTDSSTVTLTLNHGTFSTGLTTATATAVNGVATFNSLQINAVGNYTLTASDASLTTAATNSLSITKGTPTVSWTNPASIVYGTALSSLQLDATASLPGTFVYTPAAGTVLGAGSAQTLSVVFTPTDSADYSTANGSATITVTQATPTITWSSPSSIAYPTPLSSTQLDATANTPGNFVYTPAAGTVLNPGGNQSLGVMFTPTDTTDYTAASASVSITVTGVVSQPINLTGSSFYLKLDTASPQNLNIWTNSTGTGTPAVVQALNTVSSITLSANTAGDNFVADFSNGNIVPAGGLTLSGFGSAAANSLTVIGTGGSDTVTVPGNGSFNLNTQSIAYSTASIGNVYFAPGGNGEALTIPTGSVTLAPSVTGKLAVDTFSNITLASGASLLAPAAANHTSRLLIQTGALNLAGNATNWTSTLDLSNNDLDVANGNLLILDSQVGQGATTGTGGIISSAAASDSTHLTTLGIIQNSIDGTPTGTPLYGAAGALGTFDGINPASTDVLIKYTYYGDTNLDGTVDGSDYSRIDGAYNTPATGWFNGDFNLDTQINGSDYTLIDNAYNQQGASLQTQLAKPAASIAAPSTPGAPSASGSTPFSITPLGLDDEKDRQAVLLAVGL